MQTEQIKFKIETVAKRVRAGKSGCIGSVTLLQVKEPYRYNKPTVKTLFLATRGRQCPPRIIVKYD